MYKKLRLTNIQLIIFRFILIILCIFIVVCIIKFIKNHTNLELFDTQNENNPMDNANDTVVICAGDSILNNTIYVPPGKSVVDYIRLNSGSNKDIINISRDGDIITDVYNQMRQIPNVESTMTIILSVGGNDLLEYELIEKAYINYIELIKYIKQTYKCKLYVLNLYYPMDESMKKFHETISKWNTLLKEIPKKEKIEINIIDISKIITEPSDLVNKIEPSVTGGLKIANKIIKMVNI